MVRRAVLTAAALGATTLAATALVAGSQAAIAGQLPVTAVTASSFQDPNVPGNAVDNNLSTRWSADGDGQWLRLDLGAPKRVNSVKVAWAKGNERKAIFDIQASLDGTGWITVLGGAQSSGTTLDLQCHVVWPTDPRYVRLVGHGNTDADPALRGWNSVTELKVYDTPDCDATAPATPPTTPPTTASATPTAAPTTPAGSVVVKAACRNSGTLNNGTHARTAYPTDATTGPQVGGFSETAMRPSGVTGKWTVTQAGAVINGVYHNGIIEVRANNVTIRNSIICGTSTLLIRNYGTNLVIENSILRGERGTVQDPETGTPCQATIGYANYIIRRSELTGCNDGVKASGVVEIHNSWFHDNYTNRFGGGAGTHNDTVQTTDGVTTRFVFNGNAAYQDHCTSNAHFQMAPTGMPGNIGYLRVQNNFFYGITGFNFDREQGTDDGLIGGNLFAGSRARGPFNHALLYRGAEMGTVGVSGNTFESGEAANTNPPPSYVCAAS